MMFVLMALTAFLAVTAVAIGYALLRMIRNGAPLVDIGPVVIGKRNTNSAAAPQENPVTPHTAEPPQAEPRSAGVADVASPLARKRTFGQRSAP